MVATDWWRYWRSEGELQSFSCRGSAHASRAGMTMMFNPDDPHDGHACDEAGFTYRMIHLGPELVTGVLTDVTGRRAGLPLFAEPVVADPALAGCLRGVHRALLGGATALRRDELVAAAVRSAVRRAASCPLAPAAAQTMGDAAGRSRFAVHRAFSSAYGMAPGDYQRLLRLRAARRLIAQGQPIAVAAVRSGFSDQSHLARWFVRCYGVTPGGYQRRAARHHRDGGQPPGAARSPRSASRSARR